MCCRSGRLQLRTQAFHSTHGMASFEQIFNSSILNLIIPNAILEFPTQDIDQQVWLAKLRSEVVERERAFFGISRRLFLLLPSLIHFLLSR